MYSGTKKLILDYLMDETAYLKRKNRHHYSSAYIADKFMISRSLSSHYLNDLYKEGELIKVNERPVLYLHKDILRSRIRGKSLRSEYDTVEDLEELLHMGVSKFTNVIGSDYSLRSSIENIKKALHYPPHGLPIVLCGKPGSGKRFLSRQIYAYCQAERLISENAEYTYISCDTIEEPELFTLLFGKNDEKSNETGILKNSKYEYIVFNSFRNAGKNIQNALADYIDEGATLNGPKAKLIFLCNQQLEMTFTQQLLGRLLTIVTIPSLKERTIYEKESLILHFIREESKKVQKGLKITDYFMELMIAQDFEDSIEQLQSAIVRSFFHAYEKKEEHICLDVSCIPSELKYRVSVYDKEHAYLLEEYQLIYHGITKELFYDILRYAEEYYYDTASKSGKRLYAAVEKFNDHIIFRLPKFQKSLEQYKAIIQSVTDICHSRSNISFSNNMQNLMVFSLYCQSIEYQIFYEFMERYEERIKTLLTMLYDVESKEYQVYSEVEFLLHKTFSIETNAFLKLLMILNLKYDQTAFDNDYAVGLIICHGYSTASSIANAANALLAEQVYVAFDMPLDVQVDEIVKKIDTYLNEKQFLDNALILVDMGSLELIGNKIRNRYDINIGIINNTTTSMALHIGYGILQKRNIQEILQEASKQTVCTYNFIQKKAKKKAIIFTSESGMSTAEKIKALFQDSIPKTIPIQLISYDYYQILNEQTQEEISGSYDILFVAGTMDPKLAGSDFIDLGDIINLRAIRRINDIFRNYMGDDEIQQFNDDLLKNFSLINVIESLTILNPRALLDIVEKSIHLLEREQSSKIDPKILIGLHVHICCFVERMVKRIPVKTYPDLQKFEVEQKDFIHHMRIAFQELSQHYGIEIPCSEIAYIYDYMHILNGNDKEVYSDE